MSEIELFERSIWSLTQRLRLAKDQHVKKVLTLMLEVEVEELDKLKAMRAPAASEADTAN